jgi:hypothetical protein
MPNMSAAAANIVKIFFFIVFIYFKLLFNHVFFTVYYINALLRSTEALTVEVIDGTVILVLALDLERLNACGLSVIETHHNTSRACIIWGNDKVATAAANVDVA